MITRDRMVAIDRNAGALGISQQQLMESSGHAIARWITDRMESSSRICIVGGRGNNGGDAYVAARFLEDFDVSVYLVGRPDTISSPISKQNWDVLQASEFKTSVIRDSTEFSLPTCDLIVDGLVGTGLSSALREPIGSIVSQINDHNAPVLSVDIPSGIDADTGKAQGTAITADWVITFHDEKPGHDQIDAPVSIADIGIPNAAERFTGPGDLHTITRDPKSHKGDAGRILVIGGGPYTGAPALSALAALRSGADLVTVACPEGIADTVQGYSQDLIVRPLPGRLLRPNEVAQLQTLASSATCIVIGPGMGDDEESLRMAREFLRAFEGRAVVDADALQVVPEIDSDATLICTPHQGELANMGGPRTESWEERDQAIRGFAAELGHTILVKGHYDIISDGDQSRISRTGNPGMTVGGTGDVLAGVTAALYAQLSDPLSAAALGAYVTGIAGDLAAKEMGDCLLASDVVDNIPAVFRGAQA